MKIRLHAAALFIFVFHASSSLAEFKCPPMPESVTQVNRDVKSDIKASAASLGKVKAGEVAAKTEVTAKNLFEKYPNVDKLVALQTMAATYCAMLRDATTLSEKEKLDRWERFQEKVLDLKSHPPSPSSPKGDKPKSRVVKSVPLQKQQKKESGVSTSSKPITKITDSNTSGPLSFRISIMGAERCIVEWSPKESNMSETTLASHGVNISAVKSAIAAMAAAILKRSPAKVTILPGEPSEYMPGAAYRVSSIGTDDSRYDSFHIYVTESEVTVSLFLSGNYAERVEPDNIGIDWKLFQNAVSSALKNLHRNTYDVEFGKVGIKSYPKGEWHYIIPYALRTAYNDSSNRTTEKPE